MRPGRLLDEALKQLRRRDAAGFAPLASQVIYASSPGTLNMDFANLPYEKLTTPYWPRIEDPFS